MNSTPERAREACESCRKSHKKCTYDDNSTRCLRCEKRNTGCSLFLSVETTAVTQQGPLTSATTESAGPDSWDATGTPHDSSTFPYQFPLQETYYWPAAIFTEPPQGGCPVDNLIFQSPAGIPNQHESEEPAMNQDGLYAHNNVFNDRIGT